MNRYDVTLNDICEYLENNGKAITSRNIAIITEAVLNDKLPVISLDEIYDNISVGDIANYLNENYYDSSLVNINILMESLLDEGLKDGTKRALAGILGAGALIAGMHNAPNISNMISTRNEMNAAKQVYNDAKSKYDEANAVPEKTVEKPEYYSSIEDYNAAVRAAEAENAKRTENINTTQNTLDSATKEYNAAKEKHRQSHPLGQSLGSGLLLAASGDMLKKALTGKRTVVGYAASSTKKGNDIANKISDKITKATHVDYIDPKKKKEKQEQPDVTSLSGSSKK